MTPETRQAVKARARRATRIIFIDSSVELEITVQNMREWLCTRDGVVEESAQIIDAMCSTIRDLLAALDAQEQETKALADAIWPDNGGQHVKAIAALAMAHREDSVDVDRHAEETARLKALLVEGQRYIARLSKCAACRWQSGDQCECRDVSDYRRRVEEAVE